MTVTPQLTTTAPSAKAAQLAASAQLAAAARFTKPTRLDASGPPSGQRQPGRWTPLDRETRLRRRAQRRRAAARSLAAYLDRVSQALTTHELIVAERHLESVPELSARLLLRGQDPSARTPVSAELRWAEDTGWSLSHPQPYPARGASTEVLARRYLHLELVPPPATVARFAANSLADFDNIGMAYPAQFRFPGLPLQPVLDALARRIHHPGES